MKLGEFLKGVDRSLVAAFPDAKDAPAELRIIQQVVWTGIRFVLGPYQETKQPDLERELIREDVKMFFVGVRMEIEGWMRSFTDADPKKAVTERLSRVMEEEEEKSRSCIFRTTDTGAAPSTSLLPSAPQNPPDTGEGVSADYPNASAGGR